MRYVAQEFTFTTLKKLSLGLTLLSFSIMSTPLIAEPGNTSRGYDIAARSDRSDRGFVDNDVSLTMTLANAAGMKNTRSLDIITFEIKDESVGDKSIIVFKSPADIKGTALLSHAKILDPDNQWIYLPALKRVNGFHR